MNTNRTPIYGDAPVDIKLLPIKESEMGGGHICKKKNETKTFENFINANDISSLF